MALVIFSAIQLTEQCSVSEFSVLHYTHVVTTVNHCAKGPFDPAVFYKLCEAGETRFIPKCMTCGFNS